MGQSSYITMRLLFDEYGRLVLAIVCSTILLVFFLSVFVDETMTKSIKAMEYNINDVPEAGDGEIVSIEHFLVKDGIVKQGETFDYRDRVEATNSKGEDISSFVRIDKEVDTSNPGEKEVTYYLRYNGDTMPGRAKVFVEEIKEEAIDEEHD